MSERLIRLPEVLQRTGISKSEIYRRIRTGAFPRARRLSHRVAVWPESEIDVWISDAVDKERTPPRL